MTNINIEVVLDTVCPFSYVSRKRLDRTIELYKRTVPDGKNDTFTVSSHPFYRDPVAPQVGIPVDESMAQRFGPDRVEGIHAQFRAMGEPEGINFAFKGKLGDSRDSHRLIQLGKTKGNDTESRVVMELFKTYFEGTGDITSWDTLVDAGEKAGIDKEEAKTWLKEGKGGAEVDADVEEAYAKGIRDVPHYTIQGKYELDGAQDPSAFIEAFVKARQGN